MKQGFCVAYARTSYMEIEVEADSRSAAEAMLCRDSSSCFPSPFVSQNQAMRDREPTRSQLGAEASAAFSAIRSS